MTATPGWYTDPWSPRRVRWHDGTSWTGGVRSLRDGEWVAADASSPGELARARWCNSRSSWPLLGLGAVVAVSALFVLVGLVAARDTHSMLQRGRPVVGVVERAWLVARHDERVLVRYEVDGREYRADLPGDGGVGDRVELLYDPAGPDHVIYRGFTATGATALAGCSAAVGAAGSVLAVRAVRRRRLAGAPGRGARPRVL